jgi:hypothetical protein
MQDACNKWTATRWGQTPVLPEIPCAQAHNAWNTDHKAHDWLCKQQFPSVDAHCPGSLLVDSPFV